MMRRVTDMAEMGRLLKNMVGSWEGKGTGQFPTIEPFRYKEVLTVTSRNENEPTIHFHQQTWIISDGDDNGDDSHWESGFVMAREDGLVEIINAQESRRVEVLVGEFRTDDAGNFEIVAESVVHGHDKRMLSSTRTFRFGASELEYTVHMSTSDVGKIQPHLSAKLSR